MSANNRQEHGRYISATATHATAASASITGVAGEKFYVTDVSASSDKAGALMLVKQGTTVIWRSQLQTTAAGFCAYEHTFSQPLEAVVGALVSCEIDGTAVCHANIAGFSLPTLG
jgi:hypothetical protein